MISEKYFNKFKALMLKKVGRKKFDKMSEQELLSSATALLTLVGAVYKYKSNKEINNA